MRRPLGTAGLLGLSLVLARPAPAVLVVFEDGRTLKADGFALEGERVAVRLRDGGTVVVPLEVVERIVDDEVEPARASAAEAAPGPARERRSVRRPSEGFSADGTPFASVILDAARRHRIDPALVAAVIRVESNFSPRALSPKGARGLMQLMPATARRLGVGRVFDPRENVDGGTLYLSRLAERFGETDVERILAAYNAGEGAVEAYGGVPPYRETLAYVRRVSELWDAAAAKGR